MKNNNAKRNNFAIIGASGAGKTTLAVGLYATSTEAFTVSPVGDATRKYLEIRKTSIEEGFWPSATNESENFDLRLRLHAAGTQTDIDFREYMGERMERDPNYIREVIGTPKSAMILFNPGMPGLSKPETRNRMLGNLKVIAQHLKDNECIAVAFVVTASDRLSSDLAEFREDFEAYVSEVTNHLTNLKLDWKRFDVTVSGQLDDQTRPRLARGDNNTTHEPFLWLLGKIHARKDKANVVKIASWAACFALGAFAIWGGLFARSNSMLTDITAKLDGLEKQLDDAWKQTGKEADVKTCLGDLWSLATNELPKVRKVGGSNCEKIKGLRQRLAGRIDVWGVRHIRLAYADDVKEINEDPLKLKPGWAEELDNRIKVANPSAPVATNELAELEEMWKKNRSSMETKWQSAMLKKDVNEAVGALKRAAAVGETAVEKQKDICTELKKAYKIPETIASSYLLATNRQELTQVLNIACTNALAKYCDLVAVWKKTDENRPTAVAGLCKDLVGKIPDAALKAAETNLAKRLEEAQEEWDAYQFPRRANACKGDLLLAASRIANQISDETAKANLVSALTNSLSFLGSMSNDFPTISLDKRNEKQCAINEARTNALASYVNSIAKSWDKNSKKPPVLAVNKIRYETLTDAAVTSEEWSTFQSKMQKRFAVAKQEWDKGQKQLVDKFNTNEAPLTIIQKYDEFLDDHEHNPYITNLTVKVDWALQDYFRSFVNNYYVPDDMDETQRKLNEFKRVCSSIKSKVDIPLLSEPSGKFALLCCVRGKVNLSSGLYEVFPQTIQITKIEAKVSIDKCDSDYKGLDMSVEMGSEKWNFDKRNREFESKGTLVGMKGNKANDYRIPKSPNNSWLTIWEGSQELSFNPYNHPFLRVIFEDRVDAVFGDSTQDTGCWCLGGYPDGFSKDFSSKSFQKEINLHHRNWTDTVGTLQLRVTGRRIGDNYFDLAQEAGLFGRSGER
ncbi:MAG: hypothetical protein ACI4RD_05845 [Kiritimatiellia bacterium]